MNRADVLRVLEVVGGCGGKLDELYQPPAWWAEAARLSHERFVTPLRGAVRTLDLVEMPYIVLLGDPDHMGVDVGLVVARQSALPLVWVMAPRIRRKAPSMIDMLEEAAAPYMAKGGRTQIGSHLDYKWLPPDVWHAAALERFPDRLAVVAADVGLRVIIQARHGDGHALTTPAMRANLAQHPMPLNKLAGALIGALPPPEVVPTPELPPVETEHVEPEPEAPPPAPVVVEAESAPSAPVEAPAAPPPPPAAPPAGLDDLAARWAAQAVAATPAWTADDAAAARTSTDGPKPKRARRHLPVVHEERQATWTERDEEAVLDELEEDSDAPDGAPAAPPHPDEDPDNLDARFDVLVPKQVVHARIRDLSWKARDAARDAALFAGDVPDAQEEEPEDDEEEGPPTERQSTLAAHGLARPPAGESRDVQRSRRRRDVRAHTVSVKRMLKREIELGRMLWPEQPGIDYQRPKTRADCVNMPRPCPFVSCKHHLYLDVMPGTGAIKLNFPDLQVEDMLETCALDLADGGSVTLDEVAAVMNLTRERVRQIEVRGEGLLRTSKKMRAQARDLGVDVDKSNGVAGDEEAAPALPDGITSAAIREAFLDVFPYATGLEGVTDETLAALKPSQRSALRARLLIADGDVDVAVAFLQISKATFITTFSDACRALDVRLNAAKGHANRGAASTPKPAPPPSDVRSIPVTAVAAPPQKVGPHEGPHARFFALPTAPPRRFEPTADDHRDRG